MKLNYRVNYVLVDLKWRTFFSFKKKQINEDSVAYCVLYVQNKFLIVVVPG
jgi:hypothetical protein